MNSFRFRSLVLIFSTLLSACLGGNTPQTATEAFWEAVIHDDPEGVVEYSTLGDTRDYDAFSREWDGLKPSWGKIVIDGNEASVATTFSGAEGSSDHPLTVVTFLVRRDDTWKVDYARTNEELNGVTLANLFEPLARLGEQLADKLKTASGNIDSELEQLGKQLGQLSDSIRVQAEESIARHSEVIRRRLDEWASSINQALEEQGKTLPDRDRRVLREVSAGLDESTEELAEPTVHALADTGRTVAVSMRQLDTIGSQAIHSYKAQWQEWGALINAELEAMLGELSHFVSKEA